MSTRIAAVSAFLFCALLLPGCKRDTTAAAKPHVRPAAPQIALKAAPATPIEHQAEKLGGPTWDPAWDAVVEKALPPALLSPAAGRAVRSYCPRFAALPVVDRRAFWAYTFQAIAGAEAGLDPTSDVHHLDPTVNTKDDVTERPARQQGLLQLKYEDAERYGCAFDWQQDRHRRIKDPDRTILQPGRNLQCGIRIMQNQIAQGKPLMTRSSYWAVLRPGTDGYRHFAKQMTNVPAFCGKLARASRKARPVRNVASR